MDLLNIDLFIHIVSYLNLDDVINLCQTSSKFHKYGINYENHWKFIIDKNYKNVYNYSKHLKYLGKCNYLIYATLINTFDPISKLMFYYRRGDYKSFDDRRINMLHKYLSLFLLGEHTKLKYYRSGCYANFLEYSIDAMNKLLTLMSNEGSVEGVKYAFERGASNDNFNLSESCIKGYYDTIKYMIKNGADVNWLWDCPTRYAALNGHLKCLKYLVKKGGDIHALRDEAIRMACDRGHLDVVKYLVEKGANITACGNQPIINAYKNGYTNIVEYLINQGVSPDILKDIDKNKPMKNEYLVIII